MKRKQCIVLGFVICLTLTLFTGCKQSDKEESSFLHYEYSKKAAKERTYPISMEEAICATAHAYYEKGVLFQYDQTWTSRQNNDFAKRAARWSNTASPELATSQNTIYTDCSKFQNSIYYNTFGYELPAESTDNMLDYPELQVFYYEPTGSETDKEEKAICDSLTESLQVGDLINYRQPNDTNGHIMMYIGDHKLIHASGSGAGGGDYNYTDNASTGAVAKTDTLEPTGTILLNDIKMLTTYTESRYLLNQFKFGVLRPIMNLSEEDITQDAYCRAAFMQGIISEVTSDYPTGHTIEPGGVITYTLTFQNIDSVARNVHVDLSAAKYTELLTKPEAADLKIESGSTGTVEFQVKVTEDTPLDTLIAGPVVKANGMTVETIGHEVNQNLEASAASVFATLDYKAEEVKDDFTMVQYAYKKATGAELPFHSVQEMMWTLFEYDDYNNIALALCEDGLSRQMLVENHYGGFAVKNCGEEPGSRVSNMTGANLYPGDILLVSEDLTVEHTYIYLCTASYTLLQWAPEHGGATLLRTGYMAPVMESLLGQQAYALLRPSFVLGKDRQETGLGAANVEDYQGDVIITGKVEWTGENTGKVEVTTLSDGEKRIVNVQNPGTVPTDRLVFMSVSKGYATFRAPSDISRAAACSFENGVLTYSTNMGAAQVKTDANTRIFLVSDERQYGRLEALEEGQNVPASGKIEGPMAQWNVLFKTDKNGCCSWIVVERDGRDISLCVGLPHSLAMK